MDKDHNHRSLKIVLIRHGKPTAVSNQRVDAAGFASWVASYNSSGICADSLPPDQLKNHVSSFYAFSSNLQRAIDSAETCLERKPDETFCALREMELPCYGWSVTLTINQWLVICRAGWLLGFSGSSESFADTKQRLEIVATTLEERAVEEKNIVVFGHGLSNRYLSHILKKRGWTLTFKERGYWGGNELVKRNTA